MEFGLHLGTRGPAASSDSLLRIARRAEELGFLHLGLSDHVVIAARVDTEYPYTKSGSWFAEDTGVCLEQVTTLGFVAAATTRLRLLSSVMVLPHRPALLAAKMLTTVDILSKGRLTVGAGVGWMAEELALLGAPPFKARGAASDEYIQAFRALWTERRPAFAGRFVAFDNLLFEPKPAQRPHPPIWVGGESAQARIRSGTTLRRRTTRPSCTGRASPTCARRLSGRAATRRRWTRRSTPSGTAWARPCPDGTASACRSRAKPT
jgi:probable F420-dependent oxidoreductase